MLTQNEVEMIRRIAESTSHDAPEDPALLRKVLKNQKEIILITNMANKGLLFYFIDALTVQLTPKGLDHYRRCFPNTDYAKQCKELDRRFKSTG